MSSDETPTTATTSQDSPALTASCHCKRIQITLPSKPASLNECHCTVCYKYGALWAYFPRPEVSVQVADGARIETYVREDGKGYISFNRCAHCGCMTHWLGVGSFAGPEHKAGVNCRLVPEDGIEGIEKRVTTM